MKTTVVPAQVTTVEDKIAGNLSFTQLLLLTTPVFLDGALFVLLPPIFKFTNFKLVIGIVIAALCMTLAIRIKGKLLLQWLAVISRYNLRPRLYLFNKNDAYLRSNTELPKREDEPMSQTTKNKSNDFQPHFIPTAEMVRLETAVLDPRAKFHLRAVKGGLRVYISEIKEESV